MGTLNYVGFVLFPEAMCTSFVAVADRSFCCSHFAVTDFLPQLLFAYRMQVALTAVKDGMRTSYVEFVLFLSCFLQMSFFQLPSAGCAECRQRGHGHSVLC
jgi:hypothetical protein